MQNFLSKFYPEMNIKNVLLTGATWLLYLVSTTAQNSIVSAGGSNASTNGSVSYSVGQPSYIYFQSLTGDVSEGVQQPYEIFTEATDRPSLSGFKCFAYPNPVTDQLIIRINEQNSDHLSYQLSDMAGIVIASGTLFFGENQVSVGYLKPATYSFLISNRDKKLKSFQLIKHK